MARTGFLGAAPPQRPGIADTIALMGASLRDDPRFMEMAQAAAAKRDAAAAAQAQARTMQDTIQRLLGGVDTPDPMRAPMASDPTAMGESGLPVLDNLPSRPSAPAAGPDRQKGLALLASVDPQMATAMDGILQGHQSWKQAGDGSFYDEKGNVRPASTVTLDKGMRMGTGGMVENAPGYVDAARQQAGATAGATAGAQADFDLVNVNLPGGRTTQMSKGAYLAAKAAGVLAPGVGDSLTPGEAAEQTARGQGRGSADYDLVTVKDGPRQRQVSRATALAGNFAGQTPAEDITAETDARARADRLAGLRTASDVGTRQLPTLKTMEDLLPKVITGFGAEQRLQAARLFASTGNKDAKEQVKATELFQNQGRNMVIGMIKSFGANPTEGERAYMEKASGADFSLNEATLREGINLTRQRVARDQAAYQAAQSVDGPRPPAQSGGGSYMTRLETQMRQRGFLK